MVPSAEGRWRRACRSLPALGASPPPFPPLPPLRMHRGDVSVNSPRWRAGRGSPLGHRSRHGWLLDAGPVCHRQRQGQREDGPLVGHAALDGQGPAVTLSQLAADEEAEPGTGYVAEGGIAGAMKSLEDPFPLAFKNSRTVVRDPDERPASFGRHTDRELRRPSRVREAVVNEVVEDAPELLLIRIDRDRIGGQPH